MRQGRVNKPFAIYYNVRTGGKPMSRYRAALPQLSGKTFITDGGIETTLIFNEGLALPDFAAIDLLKAPEGEKALRKYFCTYISLAQKHGYGIVLESATWRASLDWGRKLGYPEPQLADLNRKAIRLLVDMRDEAERGLAMGASGMPMPEMVVSGCIGPRGDGYVPDSAMSAVEAEKYHAFQVRLFKEGGADMVSAITMNYVEEALGIARAAAAEGMPCAVSFTVETDGKLPTGQNLKDAIEALECSTNGAPAYYMINCAHPDHFREAINSREPWLDRIMGIRANASRKSHAELNESAALDIGNPAELGSQYVELSRKLKKLSVLGGCCGTDHRHVDEICKAWKSRSVPV